MLYLFLVAKMEAMPKFTLFARFYYYLVWKLLQWNQCLKCVMIVFPFFFFAMGFIFFFDSFNVLCVVEFAF